MAKRRTNRVDTVLFDVDDTLLDSYSARVRALQGVFTQAKIPGINAEKFLSDLQGSPFQDALDRMGVERNITGSLFTSYRRIYWFQKGRIHLYPGIKQMLEKLISRGLKLGIVTSKLNDFEFEGKRIGCRYELKDNGIAGMFSTIIGFENVNKYKPHPEGINLALARLGSQPQGTLFVGDSAADIEAAHKAGCLSCHATWGVSDGVCLPPNVKPHFTAGKPDDLLSLDCISD